MNSISLEQRIINGLQMLSLDTGQSRQLLEFVELLQKWNKTYNLTAIRDPEQMVILHVLDSASVYSHLTGKTIIDIGTGAGIPGLILAILNPELHLTLLDASHKKTRFIRYAVRQLQLANVEVVCERVEKYHPRTLFDVVISRAFSEVGSFLRLAGHLVSDNGYVLAMKGPREESENKSVEYGFEWVEEIDIEVPYLDAKRRLLKFKKNE